MLNRTCDICGEPAFEKKFHTTWQSTEGPDRSILISLNLEFAKYENRPAISTGPPDLCAECLGGLIDCLRKSVPKSNTEE